MCADSPASTYFNILQLRASMCISLQLLIAAGRRYIEYYFSQPHITAPETTHHPSHERTRTPIPHTRTPSLSHTHAHTDRERHTHTHTICGMHTHRHAHTHTCNQTQANEHRREHTHTHTRTQLKRPSLLLTMAVELGGCAEDAFATSRITYNTKLALTPHQLRVLNCSCATRRHIMTSRAAAARHSTTDVAWDVSCQHLLAKRCLA